MSSHSGLKLAGFLLFLMCLECSAKLTEKENEPILINSAPTSSGEVRSTKKFQMHDGASAALMFADDFKQTIERYLFGLCPPTFKSHWSQTQLGRSKNTTDSCDLDAEQQDLAGRFASLSLRVHTLSRTSCGQVGAALANALGELARTAATRHQGNVANNEAAKKRKLSKSQKAKIQAKQRTALAVKKKAAAAAAAAAAKVAV